MPDLALAPRATSSATSRNARIGTASKHTSPIPVVLETSHPATAHRIRTCRMRIASASRRYVALLVRLWAAASISLMNTAVATHTWRLRLDMTYHIVHICGVQSLRSKLKSIMHSLGQTMQSMRLTCTLALPLTLGIPPRASTHQCMFCDAASMRQPTSHPRSSSKSSRSSAGSYTSSRPNTSYTRETVPVTQRNDSGVDMRSVYVPEQELKSKLSFDSYCGSKGSRSRSWFHRRS